jgi:hypothetical protein
MLTTDGWSFVISGARLGHAPPGVDGSDDVVGGVAGGGGSGVVAVVAGVVAGGSVVSGGDASGEAGGASTPPLQPMTAMQKQAVRARRAMASNDRPMGPPPRPMVWTISVAPASAGARHLSIGA